MKNKIDMVLDKYRNVVFLLIVVLLGALGIGVMSFLETNGGETATPPTQQEEQLLAISKDLQAKVKDFEELKNWSAADYNLLVVNIESNLNAGLITPVVKSNTLADLNSVLKDKTYAVAESYLLTKSNKSYTETKGYLSFLETVIGSDTKVKKYYNQLRKYSYFEHTLPKKINRYTSSFKNYTNTDDYMDNNKFNAISSEVKDLPGFDTKYKNQYKFRKIGKKLKNQLDDYNFDYYDVYLPKLKQYNAIIEQQKNYSLTQYQLDLLDQLKNELSQL